MAENTVNILEVECLMNNIVKRILTSKKVTNSNGENQKHRKSSGKIHGLSIVKTLDRGEKFKE